MTRRQLLFGSAAFALRQGKIDEAVRLIEAQVSSRAVAGATLYAQSGLDIVQKAFGTAKSDAVYLLASISKPMTVTGLMTLVDKKQVSLTDPVQKFIPEFRGDSREKVLVRHIVTHTSGLPDMLPENDELRKRHAPLSEFVAGTCRTPLLFEPGSQVKYQSMGILLASEIVARLTKQSFADYLKDRVFRPLGMKSASLGLGGRPLSETMKIQVDEPSDWDWNSSYWRNLGSPWGGVLATAGDVARFLQSFGRPNGRVLQPETSGAMITLQTQGLKQRYGLGWNLEYSKFGKGCSPEAFGHGGSTGTLCWHDPKQDLTFVLLSTKPADKSNKTLLYPASELVSAAG